jgi:uroporphyrinogen-III synthase
MTTPASVLVTRPSAEAQAWVERLQAQGLRAEAMPLLDISPLLAPADLAAWWQRLPQFEALMFVSGNAVNHFFQGWSAPWPQGVRCLAPGPGTGAVLRGRGVPAHLIDEPAADALQFDSQALWQTVGGRPWPGRRVLLVRGRSGPPAASAGRNWLAEQLEQAGAAVQAVSVYERRAPQFTLLQLERMRRASVDGSIWLFSSSEAIAHLPAGLDWRQARALATHPRIAQAAQQAGFARVIQSRPALPEVLASIKSAFHE